MFEIGWPELAVVAFLALIVIGPKDLPKVMRTVGATLRKMRGMARDFQHSFEDMAHDLELDDAQKAYKDLKSFNIEKHIDPDNDVKDSFKPVKTLAEELEEEDAEEEEDLDARAKAREAALARAEKARREKEAASQQESHQVAPQKDLEKTVSATKIDPQEKETVAEMAPSTENTLKS